MTRRWNQKQVIDEAAKELWSDGIEAFRDDIIRWANEIQDDLVSDLPLDEYQFRLKKLLPTNQQDISLAVEKPSAPTAAIGTTDIAISYNTTTSSGFTSSSGTAFDATTVSLKQNFLEGDETFFAEFSSDFDAWRSAGDVSGTGSLGAAVSGGKAVMTSGGKIVYDATSCINADHGTIRLKFTPNFSGAPSANVPLIFFADADGSFLNRTDIFVHSSGGTLRMSHYNSSGGAIGVNDSLGVPSWVSGTEYEVEFNWDYTTGRQEIYIDGASTGTTLSDTATRSDNVTNVTYLSFGDANSNHSLDDVQIFTSEQHSANFTGEVPRTINLYTQTDQTVNEDTGRSIGELSSFTAVTSEPTGTSVLFNLDVGGVKKYWDGAAWSNSDGTSSQSNTAADVNTNAEALLTTAATIKVNAVLTNSSSGDKPTLTSIAMTDVGDLETGTEYKAYVSYLVYDDDQRRHVESEINGSSTAVTADLDNQSVVISAISVFPEAASFSPTNVHRRVYLAYKATGESDFGEPFFVDDIEDNTTTTYTINTAPTSTITPISYSEVDQISSKHLFMPGNNKYLRREQQNKLVRLDPDSTTSTNPDYYDFIGQDRIFLYPKLSTTATDNERLLVYWVLRRPHEFFYDNSRDVDMPIIAKKALIQGIVAKGYKYRQRADWVSHENQYEQYKKDLKKKLRRQRSKPGTVRDVNGDVFGFEV